MPVALRFLFLVLLLFSCRAGAQPGGGAPWSALRSKVLPVRAGDTARLDSLTVVPGSVRVEGVEEGRYTVLHESGRIVWNKPGTDGGMLPDSARISYRVFPLLLTAPRFHKSLLQVDSLVPISYSYARAARDSSAFLDSRAIEYNGSYGRSIALGNNQDVVLSSAFNLQASGYILDSIRLDAALSDNTIPFQPEGNTQRLQEFDQIFIRLQKGSHSLQAGDYNLEDPPSYFLNFYKRAQGLYYQGGWGAGKRGSILSGLSASVARGQFARNIFQGGEGNQGPYKLTGNNGEQFFIVLANTERVYIDNVLQERGETRDYVIDYNTAEVRFMPRRLISKDSRIQVEFEYQDRNYLNSLLYGYTEWKPSEKLTLRVNAYSSQDARNQPYLQELSGDQKRFLSGIGDSIQNAFYPVISEDTFGTNKILYRIADTVVEGVAYDSVFLYSTDPQNARYLLSFAFVGEGRGDYDLSARPANGRVYDWVAPRGGQKQGAYAPVQLLVTPKAQQVFTAAADWRPDSARRFGLEVAGSNYDPNLFSTLSAADHPGGAARLTYEERRALGAKDSAGRRRAVWKNAASYEWVQDRFQAIAPYRNVEFARDWNVPPTQGPGARKPDEHLLHAASSLGDAHLGTAAYDYSLYRRGTDYTGHRHILSYRLDGRRATFALAHNELRSADTFQTARFRRPAVQAEWRPVGWKGAAIGVSSFLENNALRARALNENGTSTGADTLLTTAFSFDVSQAYFRMAERRGTGATINYTQRRDRLPRADVFNAQSHSHNISVGGTWARSERHRLAFTGTYRKLIVDDSTFNNQKPEETGLGRVEYTGAFGRNALMLTTIYEAGSGQEQKRSYTYVEVPVGQGQFTWNDYNADGIQGANEFELALYPDQKRFIRIFTPTNEYVRVNYSLLSGSAGFEGGSLWKSPTGVRKFLSRFSDQATYQVSNRLTLGGIGAYNPFLDALADTSILVVSRSIGNTVFFNRSDPKWGFDYNLSSARNKSLLTYGVEGSGQTAHLIKARWNPSRSFGLIAGARKTVRAYESALEDGRTFRIEGWAAEPQVTWIHRGRLRLTGTGRYEVRKNAPEHGGDAATITGGTVELRYNQPTAGVLQARGTYAGIRYTGTAPASAVGFALLDALQPGANYLWYFAWDRRVGKGIELSIEYEGRKPGTGTVIHTGRTTVRAVL